MRDIFHLNSVIVFDHQLHFIQLILNLADYLVYDLSLDLVTLLAREHVAVCLGATQVIKN